MKQKFDVRITIEAKVYPREMPYNHEDKMVWRNAESRADLMAKNLAFSFENFIEAQLFLENYIPDVKE